MIESVSFWEVLLIMGLAPAIIMAWILVFLAVRAVFRGEV
jgi:hypothetical protein